MNQQGRCLLAHGVIMGGDGVVSSIIATPASADKPRQEIRTVGVALLPVRRQRAPRNKRADDETARAEKAVCFAMK